MQKARSRLPGPAIAVIDVVKAAAVMLQATDRAIAAQERVNAAIIPVHAKVDGVSGQMLRALSTANGRIVTLAAAGRTNGYRTEIRSDARNDGLQRAINAA